MSERMNGMRFGIVSLAGALMVACSSGLPSGMTPGGSPPPSTAAVAGKPVTFSLSLDPKSFSDKAPITVRIWDETQRQIMAETSACVVSYDTQTRQETTTCPPGVTYRKPTPEEFQFSTADLAKPIQLLSKTVMVGKRYRLSVSGKAADDCNTAAAATEGVAATETVAIANLPIAQTMMACISGPLPATSASPTPTP